MSTEKRRIIVIGAHPADCVDLAGGTIYLHRPTDEVRLLTLTDGLFSHSIFDATTKELKRGEFIHAAGEVGVDEEYCYFFGLLDEPLIGSALIIRDLAAFIRHWRPDTVVTHHPNEYAHWDHHECGEMVCRALKAAVKLPISWGEPHYVANLLFFAVQFRPEVARVGVVPQPPDILINLPEDAVRAKVNALYHFASQGHDDQAKLYDRMNSYEREMGRADGLEYSEGFILGQPLKVDLLPANKDISFYTRKESGNGNRLEAAQV